MRVREAYRVYEHGGKNTPVRPGIPILLPCSYGMWATAASAYLLLEDSGAEVSGLIALLGLLASLLCAVIAGVKKKAKAPFVALFFALGLAVGSSGSYSYCCGCDCLPAHAQEWEFELIGDPQASQFGLQADALVRISHDREIKSRVYFSNTESELYAGAAFTARADFKPVKDASRDYFYMNGICSEANVSEIELRESSCQLMYGARAHAIELLRDNAGAEAPILQALVCGYRPALQESGLYEKFKLCGLAHIVAVSGAHLSIVVMAFACLLGSLRAPRWLVLGTSAIFVLGYLMFTGVPISAIRAAVMVLLAMVGGVFGRRSASLNALAICIMGFLVLEPASSVSISLFLSAASTTGIVLFAGLFSSWFSFLPKYAGKLVGEPLGLTLSANVATQPFSAAIFGLFPLIAPVSNIVATPLFMAACLCGLASTLLSFACPFLAAALVGIAAAIAHPLTMAVDVLSSVPYATVASDVAVIPALLLSLALVCALWIAWPRLTMRLGGALCGGMLAALLAYAIVVPQMHGDEIVMLDVGQGDAFVVRSGGSAILIDTGNKDAMLRKGLAKCGIIHLNAVVLTHPDDDHCAALGSLLGYVEVENILCASDMLECECEKCRSVLSAARSSVGERAVRGISKGDVIQVGNFKLKAVWPLSYEDDGGNQDSLCLMAELDCDSDGMADWSALFTGDAESEQLEAMRKNGDLHDVDVLKVGHHGSKVSLDEEVAEALSPEVALISVGNPNRYGHPSAEVLSILEESGARVLRTDECGMVRLLFSKEEMRVE